MAAERLHLTEEKATLLATLYGRALDARSPHPIPGDTPAAQVVERIDHDFAKTGVTRSSAASVAFRARFLDGWAAETRGRTRAARTGSGRAGLAVRSWETHWWIMLRDARV
jgi:O-methyltransferase involved in polyketide biosynthesis